MSDGRFCTVFHAVMLPFGHGSDKAMSAVIALEGSGRGRFVYHLTDGRTHQGEYVEWSDVNQSIGDGSRSSLTV